MYEEMPVMLCPLVFETGISSWLNAHHRKPGIDAFGDEKALSVDGKEPSG
jgi:hypothetical protein